MKIKKIILPTLLGVAFIGGIAFLAHSPDKTTSTATQTNDVHNVTVVDGIQTIDITAKGGYQPRITEAKANVPTTINVTTNGTFDCSAALTFPSLKKRAFLPATGETKVALDPQPAGSSLKGICAMGMYSFTVNFN